MQADQNRNASHNRRRFLVNSAVGATTAAGVATKFSTFASAGSVAAADTALPRVESFPAPSNALVTGVDPNELVLFAFDNYWLPYQQSVAMAFERPTLCDQNPVLRRGKEGSPDSFFAVLYGTVFRQNEKFRMWYGAVDSWEDFQPNRDNLRLAYAESDDGIHWIKPELGLRDYHGSKANNLCAMDRDCYNAMLLYEPDEPDANRRYKMAFVGYHHDKGLRKPLLCVAFSGDGLHWTNYEENPVIHGSWSEISGIYRWKGLYYVNGQTGWPLSGVSKPKRTMINFASPDFLNWEQAGAISFWRHDLSDPSSPASRSQVHLGASVWHRRNVLLGLYGQWQGAASDQNPDVRMSLGFIMSNDGVLFREPIPGYAFIPRGAEQSDWKTIRLLQANAFVNHGDTTYIWYGGATDPTEKSIAIENQAEVGLATFQRDRFGYLQPVENNATVVSQALPATQGPAELAVNVAGIGDGARLRIELLDYAFKPLAGYSGDAAAVVSKAGLRETINWSSASKEILKQPYRVRISFEGNDSKNVRLYAIYAVDKI